MKKHEQFNEHINNINPFGDIHHLPSPNRTHILRIIANKEEYSLKKSIGFSFIIGLGLLLSACGNSDNTALSANEPKNEHDNSVNNNENVGTEEDASEYIVTVANENDQTISIIYYPENKQEIIDIDGQAHNIEVNIESNLVWVTINPPHENDQDEDEGHAHGNNDQHEEDSHSTEDDDHHDKVESPAEKIVAYDLKSLEKVEEYPVGHHPAHVTVSKDGNLVVVSNSGDNTITMIDRTSGDSLNIEVGKYPHGVRISPNGQFAYVANMESDDLSIIDLEKKEEVKRIAVGAGAVQTGFSHDGKYAFVGLHLDDQVAVVDTDSQQLVKNIDVGVGPVQMYASYDNEYVIVANQGSEASPSDTVSIIDLETLEVVEEIQVGLGAHGIVISKDSQYAFITNMFEDTISVLDLKTFEEVNRIDVGGSPNGISIN